MTTPPFGFPFPQSIGDIRPAGSPNVPQPTSSAYQPLSGTGVTPLPSLIAPRAGVPGLDPTTQLPAVAQAEAMRAGQQTTVGIIQAAMASGQIEKNFRTIRSDVDAIGKALRQAARDLGTKGGDRPIANPAIVHPGDSPEAQVMGSGRTTREMAAGAPEGVAPAGHEWDDDWSSEGLGPSGLLPLRAQTFRGGQKSFSLEEVRRRAAYAVADRIQRRTARYRLLKSGRWANAETGELAGAATGRAVGVGNQAIKALGAIADGSAVSAALPGLGRVIGPVGFALGAGTWAVNQALEQRELNRTYQEITGGPNFSISDPQSGFRQRLGGESFALRQLGTMSGKQARELYLGVAEMGIDSTTRQAALAFATSQYRRIGMDPAQATELIHRMVANGVEAFGTLSEAMDKVADTARRAGLNVGKATQSFGQILGTVQTGVTGTAAAASIAGGLQSELNRQGHTLFGQLDFTGLLSQSSLLMQATSLGQDPQQYQANIQNNPALLGQGLQSQIDRIRDAVFTPRALQWAHDQAKKAMQATGGQLTPALAADIGRQMASAGYLNIMQFMQVASMLGLGGVTQANAYEVAAKVALGGFRFDRSLASSDLPDKGTTIGGRKIQTGLDYGTVVYGDNNSDMAGMTPQQSQKLQQEHFAQLDQLRDLGNAIGQSGTPDPAGMSYINSVEGVGGSGQRSSVLEALLRDEKSLRDKHFVVQTKDGPKEVTFDQAFGLYQDQLRRGDVVIKETGATVSETTGKMGDPTAGLTSDAKSSPAGSSAPGKVSGTVTIYADDELKRILRFATSGGVYLDDPRRNGVPAPPFPGTPGDYPSASGGH